MEIISAKKGKATVISLKGRLDAATTALFEQTCEQLLQQGETRLVIDLDELDYISSAGLRGILSLDKKARAQGGDVALCGLRAMVKEVFHISGFAMMFSIFNTAESALAKIGP